jgi:hypothetical protein
MLKVGNESEALDQLKLDLPQRVPCTNGTSMFNAMAIFLNDERGIEGEQTAVDHPTNRPVRSMDEAEEERVLTHPEVVAAIDAALPDVEAWEREL